MTRFLLIWVILNFVMLCLCVEHSYAGVTEIQRLSFGAFVVKRNDAQYDITVSAGGSYGYDGAAFIMITPPEEGIYDIDGLPASTPVASVSVTELLPLSGSGQGFQMLDFETFHNPTTDGSGVLRVSIGGTARSSGTGISYIDQSYLGQMEVTINF